MGKIYKKHGYATGGVSSTYSRWYRMIERCHNPSCSDYKYYGARGIKVCSRWRRSIISFVTDMGIAPHGKTLDRINNDGNYCKSNCRWATRKEQRQNQRYPKNTRFLTFEGQTLSISEWAKKKEIKYITLYARIYHYGFSPKKALRL